MKKIIGTQLTPDQLEQINITQHAEERFNARLHCPTPAKLTELLKGFLREAVEIEEGKSAKSRDGSRIFSYPGWEFVLNHDLRSVITCLRALGERSRRSKTWYLYKRAKLKARLRCALKKGEE